MKASGFHDVGLSACAFCDRVLCQGMGHFVWVSGVAFRVCMLCWVRADEAIAKKG
jgi:hypothetical protein